MLYSGIASKHGHALMYSYVSIRPLPFLSGDVSRCPMTLTMSGYRFFSSLISDNIACFCAGVRVSFGIEPERSRPPM